MTVATYKIIIKYYRQALHTKEFEAGSLAEARAIAYRFVDPNSRSVQLLKLDNHTFYTVGWLYWDFNMCSVVWTEHEKYASSKDRTQYRLLTKTGNIKGVPYWIPRIIP